VTVMSKSRNHRKGLQPLLSKEEAREMLGISLRGLNRLLYSGELRSHKIGQLVRIKQEDLDDYLERTERQVAR
jgi:excisionase family DNA binding protein